MQISVFSEVQMIFFIKYTNESLCVLLYSDENSMLRPLVGLVVLNKTKWAKYNNK